MILEVFSNLNDSMILWFKEMGPHPALKNILLLPRASPSPHRVYFPQGILACRRHPPPHRVTGATKGVLLPKGHPPQRVSFSPESIFSCKGHPPHQRAPSSSKDVPLTERHPPPQQIPFTPKGVHPLPQSPSSSPKGFFPPQRAAYFPKPCPTTWPQASLLGGVPCREEQASGAGPRGYFRWNFAAVEVEVSCPPRALPAQSDSEFPQQPYIVTAKPQSTRPARGVNPQNLHPLWAPCTQQWSAKSADNYPWRWKL